MAILLGLFGLSGCGVPPDPVVPDEVVDEPWDLDEVQILLHFDVARSGDGLMDEEVVAEAVFRVPSGDSVSAGPQAWLVGPENTVTLDRELDAAGAPIYVGYGLTLADYHFAASYGLEAPGDAEVGIPPFHLAEVQSTVPSDFRLLSPANGLVAERAEGLTLTWTPAGTYPDAAFGVRLEGTLVATGAPGAFEDQPWDDGEYVLPAAELMKFEAGSARLIASSTIDGPMFGFPFSTNTTSQARSTVSFTTDLVLE